MIVSFEWDAVKDEINQEKHGVAFVDAQIAFLDPERVIALDKSHTTTQDKRLYCMDKVQGGILTVRFIYRNNKVRIIGAGYWRKGKKVYEKEN